MSVFICKQTASELPSRHWIALYLGSILALSVYYFNYGASFDEGQIEGASPLTMLFRILSIALIVWSLRPFNFRFNSLALLAILYFVSAISFILPIGASEDFNDILFLNTLLQLPVLIALSATTRKINHGRWLRLIAIVLALQVIIDAMIFYAGASLWLSEAFIGGVGNPSSFGFLCGLLVAFLLFHPSAGSMRWVFILILAAGVIMSKSLFAVVALGVVYLAWVFLSWRRIILSAVAICAIAISIVTLLYSIDFTQIAFIEHKLKAVGALVGLVDYDVDSSASVSQRVEIHQQIGTAIAQNPLSLIFGHLEGKQYWPMDSQILTYLGSFGALMVVVFVALHFIWLRYSLRNRNVDGVFSLIALILFGFIFLTNRILDYFPIAIIYFMIISMAAQTRTQRLLDQ